MRDLGIDHAASRRRRITTLQQRFRKNKQRRIKLRSLKLPNLRTRLRLHRGGVQPVAFWGFEGQGLAPRYRLALRQGLATHLGLHQGGLQDIIYDQVSQKFGDPGDQVIFHHIRALHTLLNNWPADHIQHVEQAWITIRNQLRKQQHQWYHVKGPQQPLWRTSTTTDTLHQWHRHETAFMTEAHINLQDDWATIEQTLHQEAQQQRTSRIASRKNCQNLVSGLDWTAAKKAAKVLTKQQLQHMKTWTQAAIHFREGDKIKPCPICRAPATPKHIVWLCTWHHNQGHEPLAIEWTERLQDPLEEPLWAHGWVPKEPQGHLQVPQPLQGHGCWNTMEPLTPQPWQGLAVTLDATPSSYDQRSQAWIFALCVHTFSMGTLLRKGAITGMADQSPRIVPGTHHLGPICPHTDQCDRPAGIGLGSLDQPTKEEGIWRPGQRLWRTPLPAPLYIHKNQRSPDTPGNEPHLRRKQRDAALAAYERATTLYDRQAEDWQKTLQDHVKIYKHAAARLEKIYKDPQHYIHDKPVRRAGPTTKQYKKRPINQCKAPWQPNKHQWVPHRSGYQCQTCHTRVHQALTVEIIENHLQQDCELLTHEAPEPDLRPDKPVGQKITRATTIKRLPELQLQHPQAADEHTFQETTGYLKCAKCNLSVHKRTNEESFQTFIQSRCIDESYSKGHGGHSSHTLWQKGKGIKCLNCGTQSHLDADDRVILTKALTREYQGNTQRSPTLPQLFASQASVSQATPPDGPPEVTHTGHETQPVPTTPPTGADHQAVPSPPAPKKLRFSQVASPAEATAADAEEEEMAVDFFWSATWGKDLADRQRPPTSTTPGKKIHTWLKPSGGPSRPAGADILRRTYVCALRTDREEHTAHLHSFQVTLGSSLIQDNEGTRCLCGQWWKTANKPAGKGKGYSKQPSPPRGAGKVSWALAPGLTKFWLLKKPWPTPHGRQACPSQSHQERHSQKALAILVYRGLMRMADDGRVVTVLPPKRLFPSPTVGDAASRIEKDTRHMACDQGTDGDDLMEVRLLLSRKGLLHGEATEPSNPAKGPQTPCDRKTP